MHVCPIAYNVRIAEPLTMNMCQDEFTNTFVLFLRERQSLCVAKMATELGFDRLNLSKIIFGTRNIPMAKRGIFYNFMQKYGCKIEEKWSI